MRSGGFRLVIGVLRGDRRKVEMKKGENQSWGWRFDLAQGRVLGGLGLRLDCFPVGL